MKSFHVSSDKTKTPFLYHEFHQKRNKTKKEQASKAQIKQNFHSNNHPNKSQQKTHKIIIKNLRGGEEKKTYFKHGFNSVSNLGVQNKFFFFNKQKIPMNRQENPNMGSAGFFILSI